MTTSVPKLPFGRNGPEVSRIGFGPMTMSGAYSSGPLPEEQAMEVFARCFELGINHIDTAELYGWGVNETLVGKAIAKFGRDKFFLATKFGFIKDPKGGFVAGLDSSPANVRRVCMASLGYLQTDRIDLFYQHRPDPAVPIEDTVGELVKLIQEGKIALYGLSEATPEMIRRAHAIHPVGAVQSELSLWARDPLSDGVIDTCRELGIPFVPYSPLGRGLLAGSVKKEDDLAQGDFRRGIGFYAPENLEKNVKTLEEFAAFAATKNATPAQLALAWVLSLGDDIFPIFATRSASRVDENVASLGIKLSEEDKARIEEIWAPERVAGGRFYGASPAAPKNK
ncbi:putative aldo/keto reductase [Hyaloraphidium curvatum]|nr:putative aldo/keto reductase [Hyaloraphidium curvatum]